METLSLLAVKALSGGGSTAKNKYAGTVSSTSTAFPTTKEDPTTHTQVALENEDYVRAAGSTFPFTLAGVKFEQAGQKAYYSTTTHLWSPEVGQIVDSDEVVIKDKTKESISGTASFQNKVNEELIDKTKLLDGNTATEFSATTPYSKGEYVIYNGKLYKANQDISAGAFDSSKWSFVSVSDELKGKISKLFDSTKANKAILWKTDASGNLTPYVEPVAPTLSVSASPTSITAGTSTQITLTFTSTIGDAALSTIVVKVNGAVIKTITDPTTTETYLHNISSATNFECILTDTAGLSDTQYCYVYETAVSHTSHFGKISGVIGDISNATSRAYSSPEMELTNDGVKYIYDKEFGELTSILCNGDECLNLFTKIEGTTTYTYTQTGTNTGKFRYIFS